MQTIRIIFSIFLLTLCVMKISAIPQGEDSLRFEVLLTPGMVNEVNPGSRFINSVAITSNQLLLLSTKDQFYLLGWGGMAPLGKKVTGNIGSFAYTSDSLLMTIRNNELCVFDSPDNLSRLFTLPSTEMGISSGKYVMYIFDRNGGKSKQSVYVIAHGGKYSKLFDVPKPIYSLVERGNNILFSNGSAIFQYNPDTKEMKALATLPEDQTIRSLTVDPSNGRIYFSTDNMVFSFKNSEKVVITDEIGGKLMFFDGLIIFNPENKLLVRLVGLDDAIVSNTHPVTTSAVVKRPPEILTNSTIIGLVKDKLADGIIISIINRSRVDFNLSVDAMIELSGQN
ncbi:MAG: hypothetical protein WAL29_07705, partial [Bacteroidales bacterium]